MSDEERDTYQERREATERLYKALKARLAAKIAAGEEVPFSELERVEKLELRLANVDQYLRLREMFRETTDEPCEDVFPSRSSRKSGKATRASGRSPSPSS